MTDSQFTMVNNNLPLEVQWVNPTTMMFSLNHSSADKNKSVAHIFCVMINELQRVFGTRLTNIVVGFNETLVHFEPNKVRHLDDINTAKQIINSIITTRYSHAEDPSLVISASHHQIGMSFSDEYDLQAVADKTQCSVKQLIEQFCSLTFTVILNGFMPGFPYMSGLPQHLQLPRLSTPRLKVPKGAVAIAETYCGIYPESSPGGWHILGTTEHVLFDIRQSPSATFQSGDTVQFFAIKSI